MRKVVVITGGSQGIGKSLALLYVQDGSNVIIISRSEERLLNTVEELKEYKNSENQHIIYYRADVSDENAIGEVFEKIYDQFKKVDILITCAGFSNPGYFENQTTEIFRNTMNVNFFGTLYPIKCVVPKMKENGSGHVCIVASGASLIGIFGTSAYCSSKYALRGLAESLRSEFRLKKIDLSIAYLPDTDTPLSRRVAAYKPFETQLIMGSGGTYSSEVVAKRIYKGIRKKRYSIIKGFPLHLLYFFGSLLMPFVQRFFYYRIKSRRKK